MLVSSAPGPSTASSPDDDDDSQVSQGPVVESGTPPPLKSPDVVEQSPWGDHGSASAATTEDSGTLDQRDSKGATRESSRVGRCDPVEDRSFTEDIEPGAQTPIYVEAPQLYGKDVWQHYARRPLKWLRRRSRQLIFGSRVAFPIALGDFVEDIEPTPGLPDLCSLYRLECLGSLVEADLDGGERA